MKQIVALGPKHNIIKEIPDVKPNDDQILVRTKYVGVCMSEHYGWLNAKEGGRFGHEPMGIVAEVGKNVTGFKIGDRVSGLWGGGMTQHSVVNPKTTTVIVLPDNVRDEDLVLEPLACMLSAVSKAKVNIPGTKVCVVGNGYMGCGAISLLKLRGARVTAVDMRPESLANAKKYGAEETYSVDEAYEKFIKPGCGFKGFDVVMEWGEGSEALDLAMRLTKECGQLCVGDYHTGEKRLVDMELLGVRAIELLNTHPREWGLFIQCAYNAVDLLSLDLWNYKNVPTKIYPMNKFDLAHEELETKYGKHMKALIDMTKEDGEPYII